MQSLCSSQLVLGRWKVAGLDDVGSLHNMSEIEDTWLRIEMRPNVAGVIVVNSDGLPIRSSIPDTNLQNQYANLITTLAAKARACVRDLDPTNDLTFLRIRSKKNEIMVAPDKDFILIVIQKFNEGA
jgi:dynein light chain roadblock-type